MEKLNNVLKIVTENNLPFYIEHNDFISGGLSFEQEYDDLLSEISIGPNEALEIEETQSIWSARFSSYDKIIVRYAGTMESVIDLIYKELRRKFRE